MAPKLAPFSAICSEALSNTTKVCYSHRVQYILFPSMDVTGTSCKHVGSSGKNGIANFFNHRRYPEPKPCHNSTRNFRYHLCYLTQRVEYHLYLIKFLHNSIWNPRPILDSPLSHIATSRPHANTNADMIRQRNKKNSNSLPWNLPYLR